MTRQRLAQIIKEDSSEFEEICRQMWGIDDVLPIKQVLDELFFRSF